MRGDKSEEGRTTRPQESAKSEAHSRLSLSALARHAWLVIQMIRSRYPRTVVCVFVWHLRCVDVCQPYPYRLLYVNARHARRPGRRSPAPTRSARERPILMGADGPMHVLLPERVHSSLHVCRPEPRSRLAAPPPWQVVLRANRLVRGFNKARVVRSAFQRRAADLPRLSFCDLCRHRQGVRVEFTLARLAST